MNEMLYLIGRRRNMIQAKKRKMQEKAQEEQTMHYYNSDREFNIEEEE